MSARRDQVVREAIDRHARGASLQTQLEHAYDVGRADGVSATPKMAGILDHRFVHGPCRGEYETRTEFENGTVVTTKGRAF